MKLIASIMDGYVWFGHKLKRLAIKMTKWTGKSRVAIHPKHLLAADVETYWYLKHVSANDEILDVGCGNGVHTMRVAPKVKHAVGVELNEKNYRDALELKRLRGIDNADFVLADVNKPLPFADGHFDKVLFLDVLEHVVDRQPLLKDIRRVLKPSGTLLLSVPNCETRWRKFLRRTGAFAYADPDHKIEYTRAGLVEELNSSGFDAVAWFPSVYDTPLVPFFDVLGGISLTWYKTLLRWRQVRAAKKPIESVGFWVVCRPISPS